MSKRVIPFIAIFSAMVLWGTSFVVCKKTLETVNPGILVFTRGCIVFVLFSFFTFKYWKTITKKTVFLALLSGAFIALGYLTEIVGLKYTTPGKSSFLENAQCLVVPILTCIFIRIKPNIYNIISILLCVTGVAFVFFENIDGSFGLGEILSLISGICFGANIAITGAFAWKENALVYTWLQFISVIVLSLAYTLIFEKFDFSGFNTDSILRILYLGIVVTGLAWLLRNYAQKFLSPIVIGLIMPFSAVVSTIISLILGEEQLTPFFIIGAFLILAAVVVDALRSSKKQKLKEQEIIK